MKRLLIILCILLFVTPCLANQIIIGKKKAAAACDPDSNEIGDRTTTYTDHYDSASGGAACMQFTADCTGTFGYGYVVHDGTGNDNGKICIYTDGDTDANADSADLKIACSAEFSSNTDGEVVKTAGKLGGSATSGLKYWICIAGGSGSFRFERATNDIGLKTFWYLASGWDYESGPANLGLSWSTDTLNEFAVYVEIE